MTIVTVYRWMIAAYPPAFRATFADSMAADFSDALRDAHASGDRRGINRLLVQVGLDLVRSVVVQWARTSVPWLTLAYAAALLCFCEGLASTFMGGRFSWALVIALLPFVSAITFTFWFLLPHLRRRRSRPPCLKSAA
jgi:hypothetical protein